MAKLNMANMNTLFKKGYLLAGVVMAANMFIVNEMKAMENKVDSNANPPKNNKEEVNENIEEKTDTSENQPKQNILDRLLSNENIFNLFGEVVFSGFNNSFKWWDYNPGWYGQFGCFGWKSKKFLYSVVQFEFNCNLGRGALWSILRVIDLYSKKKSEKGKKSVPFSLSGFLFGDILRGFTSMPLTFHISKFNFSISFSLDSMIWAGIDYISKTNGKKKVNKEEKPQEEKNEDNPTNTEINLSNSNENNNPEENNKK